jgi:hypothetical protein
VFELNRSLRSGKPPFLPYHPHLVQLVWLSLSSLQTWPRHPCHQWGLKTTGCARVPDGVLTSRTRLGMRCWGFLPIPPHAAHGMRGVISSTGSCYVTPGKHRLLQHFRVSPVSIAWHDPEAEHSSPDSCEGGSEEKICPRIGQSVTVMGQDKAILILFVLSSEDVSLMSGIRPSF